MVNKAQLGIRRNEARTAIVLLVVLVSALIVYKTGGAWRALKTVQTAGHLTLRPYLAHSTVGVRPEMLWAESLAYLRIIGPALVLGILISAAVRMAIPHDWFALASAGPWLRSTFSGAAAGMPLMLCSCCAAPVFEGVYGRTRRLGASLAMMLAAPSLNPAALVLTFAIFPASVAAGRVVPTIAALVGVAVISALVSGLGLLILFIGAVLLLPMPTLFEIPLAYSLLLSGAPSGTVAAVLFIGPAVNLPSLLVVARAVGIRISLLLAVLMGGLAIATALVFPR